VTHFLDLALLLSLNRLVMTAIFSLVCRLSGSWHVLDSERKSGLYGGAQGQRSSSVSLSPATLVKGQVQGCENAVIVFFGGYSAYMVRFSLSTPNTVLQSRPTRTYVVRRR